MARPGKSGGNLAQTRLVSDESNPRTARLLFEIGEHTLIAAVRRQRIREFQFFAGL